MDAGRADVRRERGCDQVDIATRPADRLLALAVACAVLVCALYLAFVQTRAGQRVDDAALTGRDALTPRQVDDADDLLRTIDVSSVALLGAVVVGAAVMRGRPRLAVAAAAVIVGANVTTQVLKSVLERPDLLARDDSLGVGNILPSGHATVAMSIALAAVLVAPRRWRGAVAVLGALYAAAVGVATLTAGWHRPSDAVAGFAVVTAWAAVAAAWAGPGRAPEATADVPARPVAGLLLVVAGAGLAALAFAALVAALVARRLGRLDAVDLGAAYSGAAAAITGSALVLAGLLLAALRSPVSAPRR